MTTFTLIVFIMYNVGVSVTSTSQKIDNFKSKATCEEAAAQFKSYTFIQQNKSILQEDTLVPTGVHFDTVCVEKK